MDNLSYYNAFRQPPQEALKEFDNGTFKGTDINTMWRIKALTEKFGPVGKGWYFVPLRTWTETNGDETYVFAEINLYVNYDGEWGKPIYGIGGNKLITYVKSKDYYKGSDEAYKMAVTDAFGNACKYLGIGADVYWDNDKSKYTAADEAKRIEEEIKKTVRKKIIEIVQPKEITAQELREIAEIHNCLKLAQATEDDFNSFVEELKGWKS